MSGASTDQNKKLSEVVIVFCEAMIANTKNSIDKIISLTRIKTSDK